MALGLRRLQQLLVVVDGLYVVVIFAGFLLLLFAGDRWWAATLLLFGPLWLFVLPLALLLPLSLWRARRMAVAVGMAAILLLGPIMGFRVPWTRPFEADGPALRVLSCNMQSVPSETKRRALIELIARTKPDVVALQEYSDTRLAWPEDWYVEHRGGLMIASRFPIEEVELSHRCHPPSQRPRVNGLRCRLTTPHGPVAFCSIHLCSPRPGFVVMLDRQTLIDPSQSETLTKVIRQRRLESEELAAWIAEDPSVVVAGDFNMPVGSVIYRRCWGGYENAFSRAGWGFGYTKHDHLSKCRLAIRIDHILMGANWQAQRCWVGPDVGSDHRPVLADLAPRR